MALTQQERDSIAQRTRFEPRDLACLRCDKPGHFTKTCRTPGQPCWKLFADRKEAEQIYQAEMAKLPTNQRSGNPTPSSQQRQANPHHRMNHTGGPQRPGPSCGNLSANFALMNLSPASTMRGVELNDYSIEQKMEESRPHGYIYAQNIDVISDAVKGSPTIISNYIKVNQIPDELFRYSLSFHRPYPKAGQEGQSDTLPFNKRREVQSAFEAITRSHVLDLRNTTWATDYKTLWCTSELFGTPSSVTQQLYGPCVWARPGGRPVENLSVSVSVEGRLLNMRQGFATKTADELTSELTAINAIIGRAILARCNDVHVTE
jgi:hypothetical protein